MFDQLAVATLTVLAQLPDPGRGKAPPGSEDFETILAWVKWIGLGLCIAGAIMVGASMAVAHRHGSGASEHASRLGWVAAGCVVIGSATALVGALV